MELPIYVVDAFATGRFTGNPAAVIPVQEWPEDDLMQKIAQENNQAETAFILPIKGAYHIRWFTPTLEVNLCGHATMASAHVLRHHLQEEAPRIRFWSRSGWLHVDCHGDGYSLDLPADDLKAFDIPPFMFDALGVDVIEFWKGRDDFLALIEDSVVLRQIQPDYSLIGRLKSRGLIVTAADGQYDFISRCFYPQSGIQEDPATGSAHTTLTKFWSERSGRDQLSAFQASPRGASIQCTLEKERVILKGECYTYLQGQITL
ncbi:MAG: PhzF family phenazine biosynthesis protein [Saprospiraceae bacterium]|nr:PhzF family phenazine biosynthesis protein [Saprospiraceae bacterium]